METEETKEHRGQEDSNSEHERYYQDESWKPVKASKKRKTTTDTSFFFFLFIRIFTINSRWEFSVT